jgi:hypothetical protein
LLIKTKIHTEIHTKFRKDSRAIPENESGLVGIEDAAKCNAMHGTACAQSAAFRRQRISETTSFPPLPACRLALHGTQEESPNNFINRNQNPLNEIIFASKALVNRTLAGEGIKIGGMQWECFFAAVVLRRNMRGQVDSSRCKPPVNFCEASHSQRVQEHFGVGMS